jgi:hypothetical protein
MLSMTFLMTPFSNFPSNVLNVASVQTTARDEYAFVFVIESTRHMLALTMLRVASHHRKDASAGKI